ncbi:MAG: hypothetical protein M3R20_02165, partial [Pseudomonadota bacterium]|nr:hypothetical protein [Pseudomonadota bacterium]
LGLVADSYEWPHGAMRVAFAVIVLGFVVTLALAWYHGERGAQRVTGIELLILALLLAIDGGLLWRFEHAVPSTDAAVSSAPPSQSVTATNASAIPTSASAIVQPDSFPPNPSPCCRWPTRAAKTISSIFPTAFPKT